MQKYYLRQMLRSFKRNHTTLIVNLISLSTGLACVILIFMWVNDELNIDKFHEKDEQLYQVMNSFNFPQGTTHGETTPILLAEALKNDFPEVEQAIPVSKIITRSPKVLLSNGKRHFEAKNRYTTNEYFKVFSYRLIHGNKNQLLTDINSVVISDELAVKLFVNEEDAIGKTIRWKDEEFEGLCDISGIFEKPPVNFTAQFDILFNIKLLTENLPWTNSWGGSAAETFLTLKKGTNIKQFNEKIANYLGTKESYYEICKLSVQQYSKRYLYNKFENGVQAGGRIEYVRLFSIIAVFILLIASINFMNLTIAKASGKMKEVGIKKVVGSSRKSLFYYFIGESLIMALISLIIAGILITLFLPVFNHISGKEIGLNLNAGYIISVIGVTLLAGIISGIYPALYLSGLKPTAVLKGSNLKTSFGELWLKQGLVIFQFAVSIILIIGFLIINKQVELTQTKNLGYNRDNILSFKWKGEFDWQAQENPSLKTFMSELKNVPGVVNASNMSGNILNNIYSQTGITWRGNDEDRHVLFQSPVVSYDFIETLGIDLIAGRSFSENDKFNTQNSQVILNEAAVKFMEIENPVGKVIGFNGQSQIVGVVKDFHYGTLHNGVEPLIFRYSKYNQNVMVRIQAGNQLATINRLKEFSNKKFPEYPFEFSFLDQEYQALYESEMQAASLSKYFAGIAILISCLGLFVLVAQTTVRKTKEIGIRKVNGAKVSEILSMLNKDFIKWVAIAFVVACPIAYYAMNKWLENFAYKTTLSWWIFALAGVLALGTALLTVSWQSWRAATRNPIEALRYE